MNFRRRSSRRLRETAYHAVCPNGLRVIFVPRPGAARKAGLCGVDFGSTHLRATAADGRALSFPPGTAHFLEHLMFLKSDGDVSHAFTRAGGSCNAATDYSSTVYSFTCTDRFEDNIALLAKLVLDFHIEDEEVRREGEVIAQELKMYLDQPDVRIYQGLKESLYIGHPVRDDPAGTLESIRRIDAAVAREAHDAFYSPRNLRLVLSGDAPVAEVMRAVEAHWVGSDRPPARPEEAPDPPGVRAETFAATAPVAAPKLLLGIKDPRPTRLGREMFLRDAATHLGLELVFGRGSDLFARLYRAGVVDDSFSCGHVLHTSFGFTTLGGDSEEPERLQEMLREGIRRALHQGVHQGDYERARRKFLGRFLQRLDDVESSAWLHLGYATLGIDPLEFPGLFRQVTLARVRERLEEHLGGHPRAIARIDPDPGS